MTDSSPTPTPGTCPGDGGGPIITNLITNPSLETDIAGYFDKGNNPSTIASSTAYARVGTTSLQAIWPATGAGSTIVESANSAAVTASSPFTVSGYILQSAGVTRNCWLNINWFTSTKTYISQSTGTGSSSTLGGWVRYSTTATAPANAAYLAIQFRFGTATAGDTFYIDGAMATAGATLPTYADGSSPGWTWTGVAHASTSTGPAL